MSGTTFDPQAPITKVDIKVIRYGTEASPIDNLNATEYLESEHLLTDRVSQDMVRAVQAVC